MNRIVLSAVELPRSTTLTRALLAPASTALAPGLLDDLARQLTSCGSDQCVGARRLQVDGFTLRDPTRGPKAGGDSDFVWSPHTARRLIGLAALEGWWRGRAGTPAEAVVIALEQLAQGVAGRRPSGSLATWLATAAPGAVGAVRAEAVSWATRLSTALEWTSLARESTVGPPDRWWDRPGFALRGRADVQVVARQGTQNRTPGPAALLSMFGGRPGPTARAELGLAPLVAALNSIGHHVPTRVAGYWPDCGRVLVIPVDEELLGHTAAAVVETVERSLRRVPASREPRLAA